LVSACPVAATVFRGCLAEGPNAGGRSPHRLGLNLRQDHNATWRVRSRLIRATTWACEMATKTGLSVYLDPDIMQSLTAFAARREQSRSLIAEAAIASFSRPTRPNGRRPSSLGDSTSSTAGCSGWSAISVPSSFGHHCRGDPSRNWPRRLSKTNRHSDPMRQQLPREAQESL
jgi:hypothetical protein